MISRLSKKYLSYCFSFEPVPVKFFLTKTTSQNAYSDRHLIT